MRDERNYRRKTKFGGPQKITKSLKIKKMFCVNFYLSVSLRGFGSDNELEFKLKFGTEIEKSPFCVLMASAEAIRRNITMRHNILKKQNFEIQ